MKLLRKTALFCMGGGIYALLELLWRDRTHGSMFLLGGLCFLLIGKLAVLLKRVPLALQLLFSSAMITGLELAAGLLVNRDFSVWDYRAVRFNYLGQICLPFSLLWIPVSLFAMQLYDRADRLICQKER